MRIVAPRAGSSVPSLAPEPRVRAPAARAPTSPPTPPPAGHVRPRLSLVPPHISQLRPAGAPAGFDGEASCGPTTMTMVARALGRPGLGTDYEAISQLAAVGGTNDEVGTSLDGMQVMASRLRLRLEHIAGARLSPLDAALDRGRLVIANGEYYAMPPHADPSKREGHYVLVYGRRGRDYLVHDPYDPKVVTVSPAHMRAFLAEHHEGGHLLVVEPAPALLAHERVRLGG